MLGPPGAMRIAAIGAAAEGKVVVGGIAGEDLAASVRSRRPRPAPKAAGGSPRAARGTGATRPRPRGPPGRRRCGPASVTTPATRPAGKIQRADRAASRSRSRRAASRPRGQGRDGHPRLGPRVRGGVKRALPRRLRRPSACASDLGRGQQAGVHADGRGHGAANPRTLPSPWSVLARYMTPVCRKPKPSPNSCARLCQRRRLSTMIGSSPGSRPCWRTQPQLRLRLFARDPALFAERHGRPAFGQMPGGHHAR